VAAQRVHAAAGDADVPQQELHHRAGAQHLGAGLCWVQPSAYRMVMARPGTAVEASISRREELVRRHAAGGSTISGV
jgi:hypothetical protein